MPDRWRRSSWSSRRTLLRLAAAQSLSTACIPAPLATKSGKIKKHGGPNAYGYLSVGQPYRGDDALCCTGLCQGTKKRKGKRPLRTCSVHDTGGCTVAQDMCTLTKYSPCLTNGICTLTTGDAGFCARINGGDCMARANDADCHLLGPGAACIVCDLECPVTKTACFAAA